MSLERAHRFCIKFMQSLPKYTSTDVSLALIGVYPIEAEIDFSRSDVPTGPKRFLLTD